MPKPHVTSVNVTEQRQNLPGYLADVRKGRQIEVTVRGKLIARIVPGGDSAEEARARLLAARKRCKVGDVVSPIDVSWEENR